MESLKRSIMLLKPNDNRMILQGKNAGTLRIEATSGGVALSLKTDCLVPGEYSVYLFLRSGTERYAGEVSDGNLFATLYDVELSEIEGAAVVHSEEGVHTFCLTTTGPDWPGVMERFRITQMANAVQRQVEETSQLDSQTSITDTLQQQAPMQDIEALAADALGETEAALGETETALGEAEADMGNDAAVTAADENVVEKNHIETAQQPDADANEACPHVTRQVKINPFPSVFPSSAWVKISYPGPTGWWHYISGTIYKGNEIAAKVLGVPGEYGMAPPIWLEGFGTYMRCVSDDARGYWLMFQDAETGEVLDQA